MDLILQAVKYPCFKPRPRPRKLLDDQTLAARVQAALVEEFPTAKVSAKEGELFVDIKANLTEEQEVIARVRRIANQVAGIEVKTQVPHPSLKPPPNPWARVAPPAPTGGGPRLTEMRREKIMPYKTWLTLGGAVALILLSLTAVEAKIVTQTVEYRQDGTVMRGFLAYDDGLKGKRPGVLVVHEWWGLNDFARERALKLAGLGYVALAADMYGGGATTRDREEAGKLAGALLGNPDLLRARAQAALKVLATDPRVDPETPGGHRLLLRGHHGPGTGLLRGGPGRGGELPRRPAQGQAR